MSLYKSALDCSATVSIFEVLSERLKNIFRLPIFIREPRNDSKQKKKQRKLYYCTVKNNSESKVFTTGLTGDFSPLFNFGYICCLSFVCLPLPSLRLAFDDFPRSFRHFLLANIVAQPNCGLRLRNRCIEKRNHLQVHSTLPVKLKNASCAPLMVP